MRESTALTSSLERAESHRKRRFKSPTLHRKGRNLQDFQSRASNAPLPESPMLNTKVGKFRASASQQPIHGRSTRKCVIP